MMYIEILRFNTFKGSVETLVYGVFLTDGCHDNSIFIQCVMMKREPWLLAGRALSVVATRCV